MIAPPPCVDPFLLLAVPRLPPFLARSKASLPLSMLDTPGLTLSSSHLRETKKPPCYLSSASQMSGRGASDNSPPPRQHHCFVTSFRGRGSVSLRPALTFLIQLHPPPPTKPRPAAPSLQNTRARAAGVQTPLPTWERVQHPELELRGRLMKRGHGD